MKIFSSIKKIKSTRLGGYCFNNVFAHFSLSSSFVSVSSDASYFLKHFRCTSLHTILFTDPSDPNHAISPIVYEEFADCHPHLTPTGQQHQQSTFSRHQRHRQMDRRTTYNRNTELCTTCISG